MADLGLVPRPHSSSLSIASLLSYAFFFSLPLAGFSFEVVGTTSEKIGAGEAHYYSVDTRGFLFVALISDEGDADVFASGKAKKPSTEDYDVCAVSCGVDLMLVPANRPTATVHLGVHGHVRHEVSRYRLYLIEPSDDDVRRYQVGFASWSLPAKFCWG